MGDLFSGLFGSEKSTEVNYLPQQLKDIEQTNKFKTDVMMPAWQDYMKQSQAGYQQALPGMMKAAQSGAGYAGQVGQTLGETGESAARTGIKGLESFFSPGYGQEQYAAAMAPIQAQYQQNMANQGATFGGAGNLGSSREALANAQTAGASQAAQMQAAAQVMNNLNQQRLQAGSQLGQLGQGYLQTGLNAKGTQLGFAERPMDWQTNYGKQLGLTPAGLYTPQYPGQNATTQTSTDSPASIIGGIIGKL